MDDLERIQEPDAALVIVHDGKAAKPAAVDELDGLVNRRIGMNTDDVRLHHVADARAEIAEKDGRLDAEMMQGKIDPGIGRSAARGDHVLPSGKTLEFGVSDRRTDRVHVRILVANDDGLHGAEESA